MKIERIKRPWIKEGQHRNNPDPFYQSQTWKRTRQAFKLGTTVLPDGREVSNSMCLECYKQGIVKPMHTVDHIQRIKDGGNRTDFSNLQSLCESCHARKSAYEAQYKTNI